MQEDKSRVGFSLRRVNDDRRHRLVERYRVRHDMKISSQMTSIKSVGGKESEVEQIRAALVENIRVRA